MPSLPPPRARPTPSFPFAYSMRAPQGTHSTIQLLLYFMFVLLISGARFSKRDTLRKSRRVSRPLLKAMAVSLALLGLARLVLGDLLAETINPMDELLFGDDLTKL